MVPDLPAHPMSIELTVRHTRSNARLAVCRVAPADFRKPGMTRVDAELSSLRAGNLLQDIGFRMWRGVHVVDLRDHALLDAPLKFLEQWTPPHGNELP